MTRKTSRARPIPHDALKDIAAVFRALGDERRLQIFLRLRSCCGPQGCDVSDPQAPQTLSEVAEEVGVGLPTVSHHVKELRQAGLILTEKRGRQLQCSINDALLRKIAAFLTGSCCS